MTTHHDTHATMLVTLSGRDRPGITRDLFTACSAQAVAVTDVDQIVMRDRLTIAASVDGAIAELERCDRRSNRWLTAHRWTARSR